MSFVLEHVTVIMISSPVYEGTTARHCTAIVFSLVSLRDPHISRSRKRHTMHAGMAQEAVTCNAWLYATPEAAPRPAPSDAMTYDDICTGIERQETWPPPNPTERDGE